MLSFLFAGAVVQTTNAQPATQTQSAILESVRVTGGHYPEGQILPETGLKAGENVVRDQLQAAADRLAQLGLFAKVSYEFQTRVDGLALTFHVEDAPRVPVFFDNIPWFGDSELSEAIKKTTPFYDGTAPESGNVLGRIGEAVRQFLESRHLSVTVEHELTANPLGDGNVQVFKISGASVTIAKVEFADPLAISSPALQQHISELQGRPYSRIAIDLFLAEQLRPIYDAAGYLRVKLGPPEIRLTGNPNRPLPDSLGVFIPVATGEVYHWKGVSWPEKPALPAAALNDLVRLKPGEVANGLAVQAGWEAVEEEYGRHGYIEARVEPRPIFDDAAHTISYQVSIEEGPQYRMGEMVLTGVSLASEKLIHERWPILAGQVFDKIQFEEFLTNLQHHKDKIFGELPLHYDEVGHWLRTDAKKGTVDVLLDFK